MLTLRRMMKNRKGFTLVELMVVVVIIGVLVAIAVPIFNATQANAKEKACKANLRTLNGAASMYRTESATTTYPAAAGDLVGTYIQTELPTCPTQPTVQYGYSATTGTFSCTVTDHSL